MTQLPDLLSPSLLTASFLPNPYMHHFLTSISCLLLPPQVPQSRSLLYPIPFYSFDSWPFFHSACYFQFFLHYFSFPEAFLGWGPSMLCLSEALGTLEFWWLHNVVITFIPTFWVSHCFQCRRAYQTASIWKSSAHSGPSHFMFSLGSSENIIGESTRQLDLEQAEGS